MKRAFWNACGSPYSKSITRDSPSMKTTCFRARCWKTRKSWAKWWRAAGRTARICSSRSPQTTCTQDVSPMRSSGSLTQSGSGQKSTEAAQAAAAAENKRVQGSVCCCQSAKSGVDRYLSPVSGSRTTMVFPSFSGRFASSIAAETAAPEEMPTRMPSLLPMSLPVEKASSSRTAITSS